jgi:phosphoribosylanthranilate isomerase
MKVKVCGITRVEDAICAAEEGAQMLGFVFAESPRRIEPDKARDILGELEKRSLRKRIRSVGVFVNEDMSVIADICERNNIDAAQIHGDESTDMCNSITVPWYRGLRVDETITENSLREIINGLNCGEILIDAKVEGLYGGSGHRVSVDTARMCRNVVKCNGKLFYLAGGVTPENVKEIITELSPDGIDLSSSLEESPGIKSHAKIRALFRAIG